MAERAVLYARVSGDDRRREGRNLTGQLKMGREYAREHGYQVVAELAEDDRGASGALFDLPQLSRALDMAAAGEFDVLVVRELDRFARSLVKQLLVEEEFKGNDVQIEYVLGEYPDTPEGSLQKNVKASVAEYERLKTAQRTKRGKRQKAQSGKVLVFARPPYGYRVVDSMLAVYEPEAIVVRLIYEWYTHGDEDSKSLPIRAIVRKLNDLGAPTAGDRLDNGGVVKQQGYGKWARSTVNKILSNETYCGTWYYNKWRRTGKVRRLSPRDKWIPVEVPAIIDRETWKVAQERKQRNRECAKRNRKYAYLLSGRLTCGDCGARIYSLPCKGKLYYRCSRSRGEVLGQKCNAKSFRADIVDNTVWEWVKSLLTNPAALAEGLQAEREKRGQKSAPLRQRVAVIDDRLVDNRRQLERLLDLYLSGDFDKEMLIGRKTRLKTTIGALEQERERLITQIERQTLTDDQILSIKDFAARVAEGLGETGDDFEKRRWMIEELDVQATLTVENSEQVAYAYCLGYDSELSIAPTTSRY
jgi:site-specific DNA recombinase